MKLFSCTIGTYNSYYRTSKSRIHYFRVYSFDDGLILDFIPVRVGDIGFMYDRISGKLYGNSFSSGNFILGPDKV